MESYFVCIKIYKLSWKLIREKWMDQVLALNICLEQSLDFAQEIKSNQSFSSDLFLTSAGWSFAVTLMDVFSKGSSFLPAIGLGWG